MRAEAEAKPSTEVDPPSPPSASCSCARLRSSCISQNGLDFRESFLPLEGGASGDLDSLVGGGESGGGGGVWASLKLTSSNLPVAPTRSGVPLFMLVT